MSADESQERKGFLIDGHAPIYSIARIPRTSLDGKPSVNAYEFFENKLRGIASDQLEKYIKNSATDMSIYSTCDFWSDALHFAGVYSVPKIMVLYSEIQSGILRFIIDGCFTDIIYDVIQGKCTHLRGKEEENPYQLLDSFYGQNRHLQLLAEYHRDQHIAPQPFSEIAAANTFLSDKKRDVYALFKGNADVKIKSDHGGYHLGTFIACDKTGFCLRGLHKYRLDDLIGIRWRKTIFRINARHFCDADFCLPTGTEN